MIGSWFAMSNANASGLTISRLGIWILGIDAMSVTRDIQTLS